MGSSNPRHGSDLDLAGASPEARQAVHDALMIRYTGLYAPVDGAFEQVARMAALVFHAPIVTVNIADDARVWFPASEGPADGMSGRTGTSPSTLLSLPASSDEPIIVEDATADRRISSHPWVTGRDGIRFLAVAPIVPSGMRRVGTLEVMDHKRRRRLDSSQLELLRGLAGTVAELLQLRMTSIEKLRAARAEHKADTERRDQADHRRAQQSQADLAVERREKPGQCQLGGTTPCTAQAQLKIADSWGDSGWGCWAHAEDALVQIPSTFLATESAAGLDTYRNRTTRG